MMLNFSLLPDFSASLIDKLLQKGSLALLDFEKELSHTGFSDYNLLQLLEEVLQESILTKKEEAEQKQSQEKTFIHTLKKCYPAGKMVAGVDTRENS